MAENKPIPTKTSWADLDDEDENAGGAKLPPLPKQKDENTQPPAAVATEVVTEVVAEVKKEDSSEDTEKAKTDVLVLGSMLAGLGGDASTESATNDAEKEKDSAPHEQLHLIKQYESHISDLMFTDECFNM